MSKNTAIERGFSLRQLVIDALRHELDEPSRSNQQRMTMPPVKLAADSPLRTLSPEEIKRLDTDAEVEADVARVNARRR